MRAKHHLLEMLPLVGPSRLSCRSVRCNRRLVEHGPWSQVMKTESRTFNLMLGDVVFHKGSLLSKMYGALPGIPQQCPTPNLTIFLSPKQHDLAGIHHCHLVLSRSEQEKMRQYEFEGHSGSWVERCSKSLLGWFQIRRDRQLMICQHVSTALDLLNLLILVFFFWKLEEFETASKESSLGRYPTNVSTLDLAHSWEFRSVADYVESLEEASQTGSQTGSASASASDEVESTRNGQIEHHLEQAMGTLNCRWSVQQQNLGW